MVTVASDALKRTILKHYRCSVCNILLCRAPIYVLLDGRTKLCCRCKPPDDNPPICRNYFEFEDFLQDVIFRCPFRRFGCRQILPLGEVLAHEPQCSFKPLSCPSSFLLVVCTWGGRLAQLVEHFTRVHPFLVRDEAQFKVVLGETSRGVLMVVKDSLTFIVEYLFEAGSNKLRYDVRLCSLKSDNNANYKLKLANDLDKGCTIGLKANPCALYSRTFCDLQGGKTLDLNKFRAYLNDAKRILVEVKLRVWKWEVSE